MLTVLWGVDTSARRRVCFWFDYFVFFHFSDCKHHLFEPDLKLVWPSAKLLQAACSASYRAAHSITSAVVPPLVEQYNSRTQVQQKQLCVVGGLNFFFSFSIKVKWRFCCHGDIMLIQVFLCSVPTGGHCWRWHNDSSSQLLHVSL